MKNVRRKIGGKVAQKQGGLFELALKRAMSRHGWHLERIENGCKSLGANRLIRVRQPFDFIGLGPHNDVVFFDCKTNGSAKSLCASVFNGPSTEHQVQRLGVFASFGRKAGFVVNLRAIDAVYWVPVNERRNVLTESAVCWGPIGELKIRF